MHSASLNKQHSLMKSVMQMKIRNKLIHSVSRAHFSLCRKETVRYAGSQQLLRHSSSSLKRCHHCNWLLNLGQNHSAVSRKATYQCILCGDTKSCDGHDRPQATMIMGVFRSWLGVLLCDPMSYNSTTGISANTLSLWICFRAWLTSQLQVRDISSLNCTIKQSM